MAKKKNVEMSEEDRLAEDKKKRLRENDERKAMALQTKTRLLEDMRVELENTKKNKAKVQAYWMNILREAKVESLKADIEMLADWQEQDIARKDMIIDTLVNDVDVAEGQYQAALESHLKNIDKLISVQNDRLRQLEENFSRDLTSISECFNGERELIENQHNTELHELQSIIRAVEAEQLESELQAKQEFDQTRDEIRNKNLEEINMLRITLENNIEELEREFENAHSNYLRNTDQRTQDYKFLTRKDQEVAKEIEMQMRKIEKLQLSIGEWKGKIASQSSESSERNDSLKVEKDQLAKHFSELKVRMNKFRDQQGTRLRNLTKSTMDARKNITDKLSQAERILKLIELCQKYETQQEKVLPFGDVSAFAVSDALRVQDDDEQERMHDRALSLHAHAIDVKGKPIDEYEYLDVFFKRFNKVMISKLAIDKEKEALQAENAALKQSLKQYIDGTTVTADTLNGANTLLVVKGKQNMNRNPSPLMIA